MISILLATHNGEQFIEQSIKSILEQTFNKFEVLVGFNGTTDNSLKIVQNLADERFRIFEYSEKGKSKTLNKLLKEARYQWIGIQDDDDVWLHNKLQSQIQFMNSYDVIGTFIKYIDENGNYKGGPTLATENNEIIRLSLAGINQVANSTALFKKKDIEQISGWQEDIDGIEDFDVWLKLIRQGKKFINIPEYLCLHRIHSNSKFNNNKYNLKTIL